MLQTNVIHQEHRLLQEIEQVQTDLHRIGARCLQGFDPRGDVVDQAASATGMNTNCSLRDIRRHELDQLRHALDRARMGQYGVCESCDSPIDPKRLSAVPYATMCIHCKRQSKQRCQL